MGLFFLKPRKYPHSENKKHFTIIIRAHDEEDVIADSVKSALKVDYPKDKFSVVVFAHNCTDKTAKIARDLGAKVLEFSDFKKEHCTLGYSMQTGLNILKSHNHQTDYFVLIDADNQIDQNYLNACNNAANAGVKVGRVFENSRNLTDNMISCMSGLWYIRDSHVACSTRSALHLGCVMNGPTSVIDKNIAYRWDAIGSSEDLEFTLKRLLYDNLIVEYINEAILYEDQPSSLDDVFKRNSRMGNGLNKLFWKLGIRCLFKFFKCFFKRDVSWSVKFSLLDQYSNIAIIPGSFVACVWFPLYYIYSLFYTGLVGPITIWGLGTYSLLWFTIFILVVLALALFVPFWLQPLISYLSEKKRIVIKNKKTVIISIIVFPVFMVINAVAIIKGITSKGKWSKIKRSHTTIDQ